MVDEFLALAYYREKGLPVLIFRLFNTVGPRQTGRYGMVVPRFVQQALRGEPLTVYGDGKQSRCFLHVQDAVEALIALAECPEGIGEVINVGSTEEISILNLAYKVLSLVNENRSTQRTSINHQGEPIIFVPYEQAYTTGFEDMFRRVPDISKIRRLIGWEPKYSLDKILQDVIADFSSQNILHTCDHKRQCH
jgi:UDP-glucose 4-epimerase